MINSHILSQEFEFVEPHTIEEAMKWMAAYRGNAKFMAGGTDLIVRMKMGRARPEAIINLSKIPALRYLNIELGLRIGVLTTFRQIERNGFIQKRYTAFHEAAKAVTSIQIKTMGTLGGNLCHGSPAADSAPPLIAFGAEVRMIEGDKERTIPLENFFSGPGQTLLTREELMVEIQVPEPKAKTGSAFVKLGRVSADLAKVSAAVVIEREEDFCRDCKMVMGSVAEVPLRAKGAEKILMGRKFKEDLVEKASLQVSEEIKPINDMRSTAWYRKEVSKVLVRDAINLAWKRTFT
ncbi:MAG: xanthine dehydrogenase family protein subunit M [Thermodesulfobacteriota bacterium]|nr:xanthine dehydrogenase family protein subunit M [Thermodesulfobacteriota bacterium]